MRIVWLVNIMLPKVIKTKGIKQTHFGGGWLTGISEGLLTKESIESLCVISPSKDVREIESGSIGKLVYYIYPEKGPLRYDNSTGDYLNSIISEYKPELIHIFGSEYPRSLSMVETTNGRWPIVLSLTGIINYCYYSYYGNIEEKYCQKSIFRRLCNRFVHMQILSLERDDFYTRSKYEKRLIESTEYFIGRTNFDKSIVRQLNRNATYYHCGEILRGNFYKSKIWSYEKCVPHRIFVNNGGYPIKGLHYLLRALPIILKQYPDTQVYVAGTNMLYHKDRLKQFAKRHFNDYSRCIYDMCKNDKLLDNLHFTGLLSADDMESMYLSANVFVLPSVIENSPNSLGEAMLLGVPCVAANVGGVSDLFRDKVDGFLYPYDEHYMLAYYVCEMFDNPQAAQKMGVKARETANALYDADKNIDKLLEIYTDISKEALSHRTEKKV